MASLFHQEWMALQESDETRPKRWRSFQKIPYETVKRLTEAQDPEFVRFIVSSLWNGDVFILQGAYDPAFLEKLKVGCFERGRTTPSSFHKMLEGVPDFHRIVDASIAKNYKIETIRHIHYFFPWNDDPLNIMDPIYERWRVMKAIGGYDPHQYEKNTPQDGIVDRVIIAQYPSGSGELETHSDPYKFQRTIMGAKMSVRGVDYKSGGLYFVDAAGNEVDIEDEIQLGDMYISYATVFHGVKAVDPGETTDWNSMRGRWFLGLYSAQSDVVQDRHTCWSIPKEEYQPSKVEDSRVAEGDGLAAK